MMKCWRGCMLLCPRSSRSGRSRWASRSWSRERSESGVCRFFVPSRSGCSCTPGRVRSAGTAHNWTSFVCRDLLSCSSSRSWVEERLVVVLQLQLCYWSNSFWGHFSIRTLDYHPRFVFWLVFQPPMLDDNCLVEPVLKNAVWRKNLSGTRRSSELALESRAVLE